MANKDISPKRIASYVSVHQDMLVGALELIDTIGGLDLGDFPMPTVTGGPGKEDIHSTPPVEDSESSTDVDYPWDDSNWQG